MNNAKTTVFYFFPALCAQDLIQYEFAKKCDCVRIIRFDSSRHGITAFSINLPELISWPVEKMNLFYVENIGKKVQQIPFSIKVSGVWKTVTFCLNRAQREILCRIGKKR